MAQVTIFIAGRSYILDCDDGQEQHLKKLGDYLDTRIRELQASSGIKNDIELLVVTGILLSDDLSDARSEIATLKKQLGSAESKLNQGSGHQPSPNIGSSQVSPRLEVMARRMERLAETVQGNYNTDAGR